MIDPDTPCKVIGIRNGVQRLGRRGVAACKPGVILYYLWHEPTKLFYLECYVDEPYAIRKAMVTTGPRSLGDVAEAWRTEPKYCHHSFKTEG